MRHTTRRSLRAAALVALALMLAPATAAALDLGVSGRVGGNWSLLTQPTDPAGAPTLLNGSAFDGVGFAAGAAVHYPLVTVKSATLELEAGLLYSHHSAEGFEENVDTGERRVVTLSADMLRVPVLVNLRAAGQGSGFRLGVGVEPMLGLHSGATVELENSDAAADPLFTTPTTHFGLTGQLAFDWQATPNLIVPLELRGTWDPSVAESTLDRFENYESMREPGEYQVAFDWQVLFMAGVRWEL